MSKRTKIAENIVRAIVAFIRAKNITKENLEVLKEPYDKMGMKARELKTWFVENYRKEGWDEEFSNIHFVLLYFDKNADIDVNTIIDRINKD